MKQLLLMAFAMILFSACQQPTSSSTTTTSDSSRIDQGKRNQQTALASVEAYATGNPDSVLKDVSKDAIDYGDGSEAPIEGRDSIKAMMKNGMDIWTKAFPDYKMESAVATSNGDTVLVWTQSTGTWKGDLMGQKPTGKSFKIYGVDYFLFNNSGQITEHRSTPMNSEIAHQVGFNMPAH